VSASPAGGQAIAADDGCQWKPLQHRSAIGSGQLVAVDPAAKLLSDVIGRML
jgi:hypothetical protein